MSHICQPTPEDIKQHYLPTYLLTYLPCCLSSSASVPIEVLTARPLAHSVLSFPCCFRSTPRSHTIRLIRDGLSGFTLQSPRRLNLSADGMGEDAWVAGSVHVGCVCVKGGGGGVGWEVKEERGRWGGMDGWWRVGKADEGGGGGGRGGTASQGSQY